MNGATTNGNGLGKAPLDDSSMSGNGRRGDGPIIKVQPPRREDLQPSYAQVIKPDTEDDSQHGWYGSMITTLGSCLGTLGAIPCCVVCPNPYKVRPVRVLRYDTFTDSSASAAGRAR